MLSHRKTTRKWMLSYAHGYVYGWATHRQTDDTITTAHGQGLGKPPDVTQPVSLWESSFELSCESRVKANGSSSKGFIDCEKTDPFKNGSRIWRDWTKFLINNWKARLFTFKRYELNYIRNKTISVGSSLTSIYSIKRFAIPASPFVSVKEQNEKKSFKFGEFEWSRKKSMFAENWPTLVSQ